MDDELTPEDEVMLESKLNLADARKDVGNDDEPYDILEDVDNPERCSEWAIAYAMAPYNVGDTLLASEWNDQLQVAIMQQYMDTMVELGYMEAVFTDEDDLGYRLTQKGTEYAIKRKLGL
jgi:hypothetical protein